jgi:hypothetical protein
MGQQVGWLGWMAGCKQRSRVVHPCLPSFQRFFAHQLFAFCFALIERRRQEKDGALLEKAGATTAQALGRNQPRRAGSIVARGHSRCTVFFEEPGKPGISDAPSGCRPDAFFPTQPLGLLRLQGFPPLEPPGPIGTGAIRSSRFSRWRGHSSSCRLQKTPTSPVEHSPRPFHCWTTPDLRRQHPRLPIIDSLPTRSSRLLNPASTFLASPSSAFASFTSSSKSPCLEHDLQGCPSRSMTIPAHCRIDGIRHLHATPRLGYTVRARTACLSPVAVPALPALPLTRRPTDDRSPA